MSITSGACGGRVYVSNSVEYVWSDMPAFCVRRVANRIARAIKPILDHLEHRAKSSPSLAASTPGGAS